jgi:hypothetical protein
MQQSENQQGLVRFSFFDPPALTVIVYGGVIALYLFGDLNAPFGRTLLIPAILGIIIVPIFTFRALGQTLMSTLGGGMLMRFTSGILAIERRDGQLRYGLNTRWRRYTGGAHNIPAPGADIRRWIIFRELGSAVGIFLYAVVLQFVSPLIQRFPAIAEDPNRQQFAQVVIFALTVLVVTLGVWQLINRQLPRIWRMWRRAESGQREASIIAMTAYLVAGYRPKDWDERWPSDAAWDGDTSVEGLYGYRFSYLYALDTGNLERAEQCFEYLQEHVDRLPGRLKEELVELEYPFVEAMVRNNPEAAREALEEIPESVQDRYRIRRIQAAVALAEGNWQAARNLASEGLDAAQSSLEDGEVRFEAALLQQIIDTTKPDLDRATEEHETAMAQDA